VVPSCHIGSCSGASAESYVIVPDGWWQGARVRERSSPRSSIWPSRPWVTLNACWGGYSCLSRQREQPSIEPDRSLVVFIRM
jgi:hypothetical protein